MGKREPQIIPQKRRARHSPRAWVRGEFTAKSSGWDENRVSLRAKLEVGVKNGRWVLTNPPDRPRPAVEPVRHYFDAV